jgi:hypothetical protein
MGILTETYLPYKSPYKSDRLNSSPYPKKKKSSTEFSDFIVVRTLLHLCAADNIPQARISCLLFGAFGDEFQEKIKKIKIFVSIHLSILQILLLLLAFIIIHSLLFLLLFRALHCCSEQKITVIDFMERME